MCRITMVARSTLSSSSAASDVYKRQRQDMFETKITAWKSEARVGSDPIGDGNSFTNAASHPLAMYIAELAKLRATYPALANGQMQIRSATGNTLVLSKWDPVEKIEYLVAFNNGKQPSKVTVNTSSTAKWKSLFGSSTVSNKGASVTLTVPAFDAVVLQSSAVMAPAKIAVSALKTRMDFLTGMLEVSAPLKSSGMSRVDFSVKAAGSTKWVNAGSDFNSPYRVYLSPTEYKYGSKVSIRATAFNIKGEKVVFKQIEAINK